LHNKLYSVHIGISYRALRSMDDPDMILWIWIGTHAEYDKLINRLIGRI
jgi:hypothetical protein